MNLRMNGRRVLEARTQENLASASGIGKPVRRVFSYLDQSVAPDLKEAIGGHYPEVPRQDIKSEAGTWRFKRGYDTAVIDTRAKTIHFEYPTVNTDMNEQTINALLELFDGKITEVKK